MYVCTDTNVWSPIVQANNSNTYANGTTQTFPSILPNPSLVIGATIGDISTVGPIGGVWLNIQGLDGNPHIDFWDGNFSHANLNEQDTPCDMSNGCSGSGETALNVSPQFTTPNVGNASGLSYNAQLPSFDFYYYCYVGGGCTGSTPPGFTATCNTSPGAGLMFECYDPTYGIVWSFNGGAKQAMPSVVAAGTTAMTTSAIGNGACGSNATNTVTQGSAGNIASTDAVEWGYSGTISSNPGILIVVPQIAAGSINFKYCNGSGGSVTPSAATINWRVIR